MKARAKWVRVLSLVMIFYSILPGQRVIAQATTPTVTPAQESSNDGTSAADQAAYILFDWIGGLLGLIEGPGVIFGALGGVYAIYEYLKDLRVRQQERIEEGWNQEYVRRQTEKNFIDTLKRAQYSHLFDPDRFKSPFFDGADVAQVGSLADTFTKRLPSGLASQQQLLIGERQQYQLFQLVRSPEPDVGKISTYLYENPTLIHAIDEEGNTLLHYAAILGNVELTDLLIQQGADITAPDNSGHTPLLIAANSHAFNRNMVFIRLLDSLTSVSDRELSALFHIIAQRHDTDGISRTLMEALIRRSFHLRFRFHHTPRCGLVNLKGKMNCQSENGLTLLHESTIVLNTGLIQLLVEQGLLDIDEVDDSGNTPLHYAVQYDHTENQAVLVLLLSLGANINARNNQGETVLHIAVNKNNLPMVRRLLNQPELDINIKNHYGDTPLFAACRSSGKSAIVQCILNQPVEHCLINSEGQTPLHLAVILPAGTGLVRTLLDCRHINSHPIRNHLNNNGQSASDLACPAALHLLETTWICSGHISLEAEALTEEGSEDAL